MSIDRRRDIASIIESVVARSTRFLRHYIGQVVDVNDPLTRGRVLVTVPELGWDTNARGAWCWPRDKASMVVPAVGQWVEVYFIGGDPDRPVYLGVTGEIRNSAPQQYRSPKKRVIYEDPDTGDWIVYDADAKTLTANVNGDTLVMGGGKVEVNGNSKFFVTHSELNTALQNMVTWVNAHMHPTAATGSPSPPSPPALTLDISSAKAGKAVTG